MPDDHFGQQKKKSMYLQAKLTFRGKNDGIVIFLTFGIMVKQKEKKKANQNPNGVGRKRSRNQSSFFITTISRFYTEVTKPINDFTAWV